MLTVGPRPMALGPGETSATTPSQDPSRDPLARGARPEASTPATPLEGPQAVRPLNQGQQSVPTAANRAEPEAVARDRAAPGAQDPSSDPAQEVPNALPSVLPSRAGGQQAFAEIPMRVMEEIARLRDDTASRNASGVPGRNDPTPMPASPQAIGTGGMPYDAA